MYIRTTYNGKRRCVQWKSKINLKWQKGRNTLNRICMEMLTPDTQGCFSIVNWNLKLKILEVKVFQTRFDWWLSETKFILQIFSDNKAATRLEKNWLSLCSCVIKFTYLLINHEWINKMTIGKKYIGYNLIRQRKTEKKDWLV